MCTKNKPAFTFHRKKTQRNARAPAENFYALKNQVHHRNPGDVSNPIFKSVLTPVVMTSGTSARLQTAFVLNWVWGTRLWYYLKVTQFWGSNEEWNKTSQQQKPNPPHYDFVKIKTKRPKKLTKTLLMVKLTWPPGRILCQKSESVNDKDSNNVLGFSEHKSSRLEHGHCAVTLFI